MSEDKVVSPEAFSERVLLRSKATNETILESLAAVVEDLDLEEESVKKMITPPLLSRLEAECADNRLIKSIGKSKKLISFINGANHENQR